MRGGKADRRAEPNARGAAVWRNALVLKSGLKPCYRGAAQLGFSDIVVVAIVLAILLFAAWKQFPAYNRPFTPKPVLSPLARHPAARSAGKPAPQSTSQR
jgi:hypothetical protein